MSSEPSGEKKDVLAQLKHFLCQYPDDLPLLAGFTGLNEKTIARWRDGDSVPIGESLLAVEYFLVRKGYEVSEFTLLDPRIRDFGALVVYGILTIKDAQEALDYGDAGGVFRILLGKTEPSPARLDKIAEYVTTYRKELDAEYAATDVGQSVTLDSNQAVTAPKASVLPPVHQRNMGGHDKGAVITALAHLIRAATPLAKMVNSEEFSDGEREQLRKEAGERGVFDLSNLLNWLCSVDARKHWLKRK